MLTLIFYAGSHAVLNMQNSKRAMLGEVVAKDDKLQQPHDYYVSIE